jgi:hypothetical protein
MSLGLARGRPTNPARDTRRPVSFTRALPRRATLGLFLSHPGVEPQLRSATLGRRPHTKTPPCGHVVLVLTPNEAAQPSYRAYLVAENDSLKARALVARHNHPNEIAYTLAAFPDVLQQIVGLQPGGYRPATWVTV